MMGNTEETRTNFVTSRGAVLAVKMKLHNGEKIGLRNLKSGRNSECTITSLEMLAKDVQQLEIQFLQNQPDFWPVQFPAETSSLGASTLGLQHTREERALPTEPALISSNEPLDLSAHRNVRSNFEASSVDLRSFKPEPLAATGIEPKAAYGATTQQFSNTVARDSVAQFRAANRAAYRRQQQLKFAYGAVAAVVVLVAVVVGRPYLQHRAESTPAVDTPPIVVERPHVRVLQAPAAVAQQPVAPPPVAQPQPVARETAAPPVAIAAPELSFHPNAADLANTEPENSPTEEVSVHHAAETAAPSKVAEDEPIAFPVKMAESSTANGPAPVNMIGDMANHSSPTSAVLGSQPTKKITPLKLISSVSAGYPPLARQYRVEGQVVVLAEIDKTGTVVGAKALSGPPMLRQSAADAVRKWKYRPAMLDDKPVASTDTVTLSFKVH
jgi:TonB family protein